MAVLKQFINCRILRDHKIITEDIWVRDGKILNPEKLFFDEQIQPDIQIDCKGCIITPGFIELQINGGYGYDFSDPEHTENSLAKLSKELLSHGVTSFCPTLVTTSKEVYQQILPKIKFKQGGQHGATVLGAHTEGPFISKEKHGAHPTDYILDYNEGFSRIEEMYGNLDNIKIVTVAPELPNTSEVIKELVKRNIVVSLGHSMANLSEAEMAVKSGAKLITHLFNAMLPFHHRDPGLVGLLASDKVPEGKTVYFGIISDGIHTHPAALRIAYRVNPKGLVLVTDAISAMGLEEGEHTIGQLKIQMRDHKAYIANTDTLCGSTTPMINCVQILYKATGCSLEYALETASLHPAEVLGIENLKGSLNFGADADFLILNDNCEIESTWIAGECVYKKNDIVVPC